MGGGAQNADISADELFLRCEPEHMILGFAKMCICHHKLCVRQRFVPIFRQESFRLSSEVGRCPSSLLYLS